MGGLQQLDLLWHFCHRHEYWWGVWVLKMRGGDYGAFYSLQSVVGGCGNVTEVERGGVAIGSGNHHHVVVFCQNFYIEMP